MGVDDVFYDGKAESGAADFSAAGFVNDVKTLEYAWQMFG
jgi:hypothetical protein